MGLFLGCVFDSAGMLPKRGRDATEEKRGKKNGQMGGARGLAEEGGQGIECGPNESEEKREPMDKNRHTMELGRRR